MKGKNLKWSPSVPQKRPDNIMSSEYTNTTAGPFLPSYEKEEVNMFDLLSMHYAKVWLSERTEEKTIALSSQDNDFLVRRYVIRGLLMRKKEQEQEKPFKMKKFMNVPSKIRIRTKEEIDQLKYNLNDQQKKDIEKEAKAGIGIPEKGFMNDPSKIRKWTQEEIDQLKYNLDYQQKKDIEKEAKAGKSIPKFMDDPSKIRKWTQEEIDQLKYNVDDLQKTKQTEAKTSKSIPEKGFMDVPPSKTRMRTKEEIDQSKYNLDDQQRKDIEEEAKAIPEQGVMNDPSKIRKWTQEEVDQLKYNVDDLQRTKQKEAKGSKRIPEQGFMDVPPPKTRMHTNEDIVELKYNLHDQQKKNIEEEAKAIPEQGVMNDPTKNRKWTQEEVNQLKYNVDDLQKTKQMEARARKHKHA